MLALRDTRHLSLGVGGGEGTQFVSFGAKRRFEPAVSGLFHAFLLIVI